MGGQILRWWTGSMIMQGRGRGSIDVKEWQYMSHKCPDESIHRAVARTLIWGGGVYSYIRVLPD